MPPSERSELGVYQTFPIGLPPIEKNHQCSLKITRCMLHTLISNAIFSQKKKARVGKLYTPTFTTDTASIWSCSKNVNHFSKDVNVPKKFVKFHHFSDLQNHVALRAILRPEYEGYIRNTIYRCEKDGQTQILVISDFWIFNFCHTDFCKPFSWIFNFCKKSNNQKTACTKSRFSQQPSKLGIEVGGVLKTKNRAEQLLFYTLN